MPSTTVNTANGKRLGEYFTPGFMLVLNLQSGRNLGAAKVLRQRIQQFLLKIEKAAAAAGYREKSINKALFALVAFLDETIISANWAEKHVWRENPLQIERYQNFNAGEEFYTHLEEMLRRPAAEAEVLEVYYLCLVLGFRGQYMRTQEEKRRLLISDVHRELQQVFEHPGQRLSPQGVLPPAPRETAMITIGSYKVPVWMYYLTISAFGILLYFGLYYAIAVLSDGTLNTINGIVALKDYLP